MDFEEINLGQQVRAKRDLSLTYLNIGTRQPGLEYARGRVGRVIAKEVVARSLGGVVQVVWVKFELMADPTLSGSGFYALDPGDLDPANPVSRDALRLAFGERQPLKVHVKDQSLTTPQEIPTSEVREKDPTTGAEKGSKEERFDLIPPQPLRILAKVYGRGARKYADRNWEKGYRWGLSFAAMMRHAWAYWAGETDDPESGLPHMAHVAWHALALIEYSRTHPDKDDRP